MSALLLCPPQASGFQGLTRPWEGEKQKQVQKTKTERGGLGWGLRREEAAAEDGTLWFLSLASPNLPPSLQMAHPLWEVFSVVFLLSQERPRGLILFCFNEVFVISPFSLFSSASGYWEA